INATAGLLFITQGRGPELLKVDTAGLAIAVIAIVSGLPFGPVGIAASLALSILFVRVPLYFWFAGRKGPVSVADLYASVMPSVTVGGAILGVGFIFRHAFLVGASSPIVALGLCACVALAVSVLCFSINPRSRRALASIRPLLSRILCSQKAAT